MLNAHDPANTLEADIFLIVQYSHLEVEEIEETELREAVAAAHMRTLEAMSDLINETKPLAAKLEMPCETLNDVGAVLARAKENGAKANAASARRHRSA